MLFTPAADFRYRLYGTWKNESHNQHPQLIRKRADLIKMSKSLMKRISKENVKPLGRLMGKLTHNAPGYMFEYVSTAMPRLGLRAPARCDML